MPVPVLSTRFHNIVCALAVADVPTGPPVPPVPLPSDCNCGTLETFNIQSGYDIVDGPNGSFASFALHAWQDAVDKTAGLELENARASFPDLVAAQQAAADFGNVNKDVLFRVDEGATVVLEGAGGGKVEIPAQAARACWQIRPILPGCNVPIRLPGLSVTSLAKVKEHCINCEQGVDNELSEEDEIRLRETPIQGWELEFCNVDLQTLFEMILAANCLNAKMMLNLTCKAVAEMIKGKSPEDIKKIFGIEGDFTEEEKAQVLEENPWLREDNQVGNEAVEEEGAAAAAAAAVPAAVPAMGGGQGGVPSAAAVERPWPLNVPGDQIKHFRDVVDIRRFRDQWMTLIVMPYGILPIDSPITIRGTNAEIISDNLEELSRLLGFPVALALME